MTAHIMFDDVNLDLIPPSATVIGVYTDGRFKDEAEARARFPHATFVTIAASPADDADILDVEPGDGTIPDVYDWLTRQLKRGAERPGIYISVSKVDLLMLTMNANNFKRAQYRLWSAHWGAGEHTCGPQTCKQTQTACDWTQWTDQADHKSLDESTLGTEAPAF